ncbi:hypothetical protein A3Q56_04926 [Intoshia linei]|uniref:Uncharacterized protein n=1 Tax=Intoshia linei TaxID=1819745 RepID=A0A177B1N2_9BILA|nr:hypothetical protein A3Q56_04926 [Intoshia linei]
MNSNKKRKNSIYKAKEYRKPYNARVKRNYDKTIPKKPTYHYEAYTPIWPKTSKFQQPFMKRSISYR